MTDIRKDFLKQLVGTMKVYENLNVHGIDPNGEAVPSHHGSFSADYNAGFLAGQNNAVSTLLSMTDSREGNEENWRLTTKDGEVLTFYPKENSDGRPTVGNSGELIFTNSLIADYYDMVST